MSVFRSYRRRLKTFQAVFGGGPHRYTENDEPQPQVVSAFGLVRDLNGGNLFGFADCLRRIRQNQERADLRGDGRTQ